MIIGERIKEARKKKGYTQSALGELLGVTKVSICGYESGTRTPTLANMQTLMEVLDLTPDYILGRDVLAVSETKRKYKKVLSDIDIEIIETLKKNTDLYKEICKDPARMFELIAKKLNK
jgi:transcriptional regulator with XRE-family HTH domain